MKEKITESVLSAIGSKKGKMLPSGWVIEAKSCVGRDIMIFVNERKPRSFGDMVYSFHDDGFMSFVKNYQGSALIAVVNAENPEQLYIIDPENPEECGFSHFVSETDGDEILHHYAKKHIKPYNNGSKLN